MELVLYTPIAVYKEHIRPRKQESKQLRQCHCSFLGSSGKRQLEFTGIYQMLYSLSQLAQAPKHCRAGTEYGVWRLQEEYWLCDKTNRTMPYTLSVFLTGLIKLGTPSLPI